jgi:hypothetical protein
MEKYGVANWEVFIHDKCICQYCGFAGLEFEKWRQLMICHLIPKDCGGSDQPDNLVVSCPRCNQLKQDFIKRANIDLANIPSREKLIEMARHYIDQKRRKDQEIEAFTAMMREL